MARKPPRPNSGEPLVLSRFAGGSPPFPPREGTAIPMAGLGSAGSPESGRGGLLHFDWDAPLTDEARDQMLDKIAAAIGKWRMEVPTILFLESGGPLSPLAGQGLIAFSPFVAPLMPQGLSDVQKVSKFLEKPENVRRLVDRLSDKLAEREHKKEPDAARK